MAKDTKRHLVTLFHRYVANPVMCPVAGRLPGHAILETIGRRSGTARRVPVSGLIRDGSFWMVSDHGRASAYVRNIEANPRVRVHHRGRWRAGTAALLPGDDPLARLRTLPRFPGLLVRLLGTDLLTIRIDLD